MVFIFEVNLDKAAHRTGRLVHQPTGLSKVHVFCVLADLSNGKRAFLSLAEQFIDDGPYKHFKSSGRRKTGTRQNIGRRVSVKAAHCITQLLIACTDPANQSTGRIHLRGIDLLVFGVDFIPSVTLGLDTHLGVRVQRYNSDDIQVDARRQHAPALMVGMIPANFGASRCAEDRDIAVCAIEFFKRLNRMYESLTIASDIRRAASVDVSHLFIQPTAGDHFFYFC